jgi:hypothetical protein
MRLFDLLKDKLKDPKGVISDGEMCVLNRRDFLYSETSPAALVLKMFHSERASYEMYAIIDFINSITCKLTSSKKLQILQLSESMTLPAIAASIFVGDTVQELTIYAPRGLQKLNTLDQFATDLKNKFEKRVRSDLSDIEKIFKNENSMQIVLCNASNEADVLSALKTFEKINHGCLLIKGYGRANAPNCGEIITSLRLHIHCSLAGFGFAASL